MGIFKEIGYKTRLLSLHVVIALLADTVLAQNDSQPPSDPTKGTRYQIAFAQKQLYAQNVELFRKWGCAENLELPLQEEIINHQEGYVQVQVLNEQEQFEQFKLNAIKLLQKEKNKAIWRSGGEAATMIGLMVGTTAVTVKLLGGTSFGGSFAVFALLFDSVRYLRDIIRSGSNYFFPPQSALDPLEVLYACNKCFIPNQLWSRIEGKFMLIRQSGFLESAGNIDYLEFILGLTYFNPKTLIVNNEGFEQKFRSFAQKIDAFFDVYEKDEEGKVNEALLSLKTNLFSFTKGLIEWQNQGHKSLFLTGVGGIGKTEFANKLATELLPEIFPGVLYLKKNPTEMIHLIGTANEPGLMLRILRDLCEHSDKNSAIVFMDEADWIMKEDFGPACKTLFDPNAKIFTSPFLNGGVGMDVNLNRPNVFFVMASNKAPKDEALTSRLTVFDFPMPKKEALKNYAVEKLRKTFNLQDREKEISAMLENKTTFREINEGTNMLSFKWEYGDK